MGVITSLFVSYSSVQFDGFGVDFPEVFRAKPSLASAEEAPSASSRSEYSHGSGWTVVALFFGCLQIEPAKGTTCIRRVSVCNRLTFFLPSGIDRSERFRDV
jgi:hypothetical protein